MNVPNCFNSTPLTELGNVYFSKISRTCSKDCSPGDSVCQQRQEWMGLEIWFDLNNADLMRSEESEPSLQIPSVSYSYYGWAKTLNPHSSELWSQILQLESITSKWWLLAQLLKLKAGVCNNIKRRRCIAGWLTANLGRHLETEMHGLVNKLAHLFVPHKIIIKTLVVNGVLRVKWCLRTPLMLLSCWELIKPCTNSVSYCVKLQFLLGFFIANWCQKKI